MALVSYGSSDGSDLSDNDELQNQNLCENKSNLQKKLDNSNKNDRQNHLNASEIISDEEDDTNRMPPDDQETSIFNDVSIDVPANDTNNSLFASLPVSQVSKNINSITRMENNSKMRQLIDENEDINTIPERKIYKGETLEIKPKRKDVLPVKKGASSQKNPEKKAPVRIMAPSLLSDHDVEENGPPKKVFAGSSKKSGLLGLLPKPKNTLMSTSSSANLPPKKQDEVKPGDKEVSEPKDLLRKNQSFVPRSVSRKPTPSSLKPLARNNSKKPGHVESNDSNDTDSDSETAPFFTIEDKPLPNPTTPINFVTSVNSSVDMQENLPLEATAIAAKELKYNAPEVLIGPSRPIGFTQEIHYGSEAIAPYPPVGPSTLPSADDLMENAEALERLAGRVRKGRGGQNKIQGKEAISQSIIEVNQGDLTADPREWLTKTLTQEDDTPGPRCNIGGTSKRKHQITYLAAMAKQNENDLKKQWSENAQSRRAHQSKYGF